MQFQLNFSWLAINYIKSWKVKPKQLFSQTVFISKHNQAVVFILWDFHTCKNGVLFKS